jgi:hypothetical protein
MVLGVVPVPIYDQRYRHPKLGGKFVLVIASTTGRARV